MTRRAFGLGLAALPFLDAQSSVDGPRARAPVPSQARPSLRADANLVLVPVAVCDRNGHPVLGLEKEHFRLYEDNVEREIAHLGADDAPVAVGLIFDVSGSMGAKLFRSRMATRAFFTTAEPEDEFFLIEFDSSPRLIVPLTQNVGSIQSHVALFTQSRGSTALVDSVVLGIHELKKSGKTRKALVIVSDGGDNNSRYSNRELRTILREGDALVYAIGVYGWIRRTPEEATGADFLKWIAEQTGGRELSASTMELPAIAWEIGRELRNRYVLAFRPADLRRDGRYHSLRVKLIAPRGFRGLRAYWRKGYYAPAE